MGDRETRRDLPRAAVIDPGLVPPRDGLERDAGLLERNGHGAAVEAGRQSENRRLGARESSPEARDEVLLGVTLGFVLG